MPPSGRHGPSVSSPIIADVLWTSYPPLHQIFTWMKENAALTWWLGAISLAMFVAGMILVPILIVRLPDDFFLRREPSPGSFSDQHPIVRLLIRAGLNLAGVVLVLAGVAMLFLPGQGLLAILLGVSLLEFPGKRRVELFIVSQPTVLGAINWMRQKGGRPTLRLPE